MNNTNCICPHYKLYLFELQFAFAQIRLRYRPVRIFRLNNSNCIRPLGLIEKMLSQLFVKSNSKASFFSPTFFE